MSGRSARPVDRSRAPAPSDPHVFHFPAFERRRLAGGLTLLTARRPQVPMVFLHLLAPAGAHYEPAASFGLAGLTAALLDEGTATSTASEIAARADRLGTSLTTGADWHVGYISLLLLASRLEEGLALILEVAGNACFPSEEVERLRRERLTELARRRDHPGVLADERLQRVLYGDASVYGFPLLGSEASLKALDRERVVSFFRERYSLSTATLIAVGDFDPDGLAATFDDLLEGGARSSEPVPSPVEPLPRDGISVHLVDRPGAAQTELRLGQAAISRLHPDFLPLAVANSLLGGKFTSRINLNLRERHGYTYGASSRLYTRRGPAPFAVSSAVATQVAGAAAREVLVELRRIGEEAVGAEELRDTKSYLTGVFPYTLQTLEGLAQRLENLVIFDWPDDYYDHFMERIHAVDRETVLEVARRHLHPDRMAVVAVGPAEELRPQFEELGPVEMVEPTPTSP